MAFKLVIRKKLRVPVKGVLKDEAGKDVNFDFVLVCDRLNQPEIDVAVKSKEVSPKDIVVRVTTGWEGVLTESGEIIPFDVENLDAVLDQAGMAAVCCQSYLKEVGAVVKN